MGIPSSTTFQNFSAGQISPKLWGRYNLPFYQSACEKMENFIPYLQGPARFREGTKYVAETQEISALVPFSFSDSQSYILEFTHRRVRAYKGSGLISDPTGIGPITDHAESETYLPYVVLTLEGHGLNDWDEVFITGCEVDKYNGRWYIRKESDDTFSIQTKKAAADFVSSPSSKVKKIASCLTPFRAYDDGDPNTNEPANIGELEKPSSTGSRFTTPEFLEFQFAQAFDTMYIVHRNCEPRKLVRGTSEWLWSCSTFTRTSDPFTAANKYPGAITFHEQRLFYGGTKADPQKIWFTKAGSFDDFTTGTNATDAGSYTAANRRLNSIRNFMGNSEFLFVGGSDGGNRMSGGDPSEAISPTNISMKSIDNFGVANVPPALISNDIVYLQKDLKRLRCIKYNLNSDGYIPVDLNKTSDEILKGKVWQIAFQESVPNVLWSVLQDGKLVGLNLDTQENIIGFHPHSTRAGDKFKSVAVRPIDEGFDEAWFIVERQINDETKYYIEYMVLTTAYPRAEDYLTSDADQDDTDFRNAMAEAQRSSFHVDCGLTYDGSEDKSDLTLAALTGTGITFTTADSVFESTDVGRYITNKGGQGLAKIATYVSATEVTVDISSDFDVEANSDGDYVLKDGDWYLSATSLSGLDHLEGEEVTVVTDGALHANKTVSDGKITLDTYAFVAHAGLPYRGLIKTTNIESGGVNGPAQTKKKNVHKIVVKFLDTLGAKYGTDPYDMHDIIYRDTDSQLGRPPPLFSGETPDLYLPDQTASKKHVYIVQDKPLPCTVEMVVPYLTTAVA